MTDTPAHIKQLQLKIWLSKPPMERLKRMMEDNTALNTFWTVAKEQRKKTLTLTKFK
ncbi:hypothetical protein SAMN04488122_1368 [Chitinophaga arvensicola]|uniref:Uncharacterized protein n=1 Tax=Chitinophaga arvensicola TaxID=29529 RepID=A0A1I0QC21_9BACT|nr:hypothetical protein SAMN04488122_1368 [Chitinophaga arvensicola]